MQPLKPTAEQSTQTDDADQRQPRESSVASEAASPLLLVDVIKSKYEQGRSRSNSQSTDVAADAPATEEIDFYSGIEQFFSIKPALQEDDKFFKDVASWMEKRKPNENGANLLSHLVNIYRFAKYHVAEIFQFCIDDPITSAETYW